MFSPSEFSHIFRVSDSVTKRYLGKWVKEGFLIRLRQGLYALKSDLPSEEEIANRLYQPSYLSFEYALAYYNVLPEMVYVVTSATSRITRTFNSDFKTFSYLKIKQKAYSGYGMAKIGNKSFLIAEPEKALVDYLYFVSIGLKSYNERLNITDLSKEKIVEYAKAFNRPKLDKLIKEQL